MGAIVKRKKDRNFTTVDNGYLRREDLTWKAKGLLTYLMSLPEDWSVNLRDLSRRSSDGRDSTNGALRELIEKGYIVRTRVRAAGGKFASWDYVVDDVPTENGFSEYGYPTTTKETPTKPSKRETQGGELSRSAVGGDFDPESPFGDAS